MIDLPAGTATPFGSIVDVDGIGVGHHHRTGRGWQTGTTVVVAEAGATPGVDVRGGGPGTRETDALRPENLVEEIHAICLTGGSAYGLAAVDGVVAELETTGLGFRVGDSAGQVVPVVPGAVVFDLGRGGVFGNRPDADFGRRATRAARSRRSTPAWGAVGAGAGARSHGLQGGVGTSSTTVRIDGSAASVPDIEVTVGALAVVNSNGSPVDPPTADPWVRPARGWPRVSAAARAELSRRAQPVGPSLNTTIGVVATTARLTKAEAGKLASVAHDGLARAIRPAHAMVDGDTIFALATARQDLPEHAPGARRSALDLLLVAAADTFAIACTHAVVAATTIGDAPAWRDVVAAG